MYKLDEIDWRIIRELRKNSRMPYKKLADIIGEFSRVGISKRAERLEELEIIERFTIDVNYEKLGLNLHVIVLVHLDHMKTKDFVEKINANPHLKDESVIWIFTLSGEYGLGLYGVWEDSKAYGAWKSKLISSFEEIREMHEYVIWDFYKKNGEVKTPEHIKKAVIELESQNTE